MTRVRAILPAAMALLATGALAQVSPFNGAALGPIDSTGHYRVIIGGHFHGESTNRSGYPASTVLANLDTIHTLGAHLFLSTGDLYMDARADSARYARSLFRKLQVPFFNAPGNHDARLRGTDHIVLRTGSDHVLVFDTESRDGSLSSEQLEVLRAIGDPLTDQPTTRVFILCHRPVWAEGDPAYSDLFIDNTRSALGTNFKKEVYPIIQRIAERAHVYWISGSLGGQAPSSIFFQEHAPNITYIQCAVRDEPRDALLIADVFPDRVDWSALSLTGQQLQRPETYDAAWWRTQRSSGGEDFNWRLLPYLVKKTVLRSEFWWGAAFSLLLLGLVRRLLRR